MRTASYKNDTMKGKELNREQNERIQYHVFKRRRLRRVGISHSIHIHSFNQRGTIRKSFSIFLRELEKRGYIHEHFVRDRIVIPQNFSFKENYDGSIIVFKEYLSSFIFGKGDVILDFSKCKNTDVANFSFLHVCTKEMHMYRDRYNIPLFHKVSKWIKCIASVSDGRTNRYLNAFGYQDLDERFRDGTLFLPLNLIVGKGKSNYKENSKSIACKKVGDFINKSGEPFDVGLTHDSRNALEGFISEVLNNAEDHSLKNSEWYINGISFNFSRNNTEVVEVNLAIINIGLSMYDGFEETKDLNKRIYDKLEELYNVHKSQFGFGHRFEREQLFMLYMLNEGISRLKYEDKSRGNGTMNFIDSFISLGAFGLENPKFPPRLNVISGHCVLTCDNKYRPFKKKSFRQISLNKEEDIRKLPDQKYITIGTQNFPGTILEAKIYLNKDFILKQIENLEHENNTTS